MRIAPISESDILQQVRIKLFMGTENRPKSLQSYSGKGRLPVWVRVVAVREAIDLVRREKRVSQRETPEHLDGFMATDPSLQRLKEAYKVQFKEALVDAIAALTSTERNLLRYQFIDGLSLQNIGKIQGVHTATAGRMVARVKAQILASTREGLGLNLGVGADEVNSVLRLLRSRLDLSLSNLLRWLANVRV